MDDKLKSKQKAAAVPVKEVDAPVATPSYPMGEPELPDHFSFLSAQHGPIHNEEAHQALLSQLKQNGYNPVEIQGHYGYPEKSFLVAHDGSHAARKTIEDLAFKNHSQESVLHSSLGNNKLKMRDDSPDWIGSGHMHGEAFEKKGKK